MNIIKNILEEYSDKKLYQNINLASYIKISQKWNDIMGEVLSKICCPSFYRNSILTITVTDSVWANEIFINRADIFKNIKKETNIEVSELKTRIGEVKNNIIKLNADKKEEIEKELTQEHKEWIDNIIEESNIKDERMKEIFYNILIHEDNND
ncbi:DciA family protein [uncultured Brachyspira sp.]|uniref:DciA family protein n=1 Tax=uncultured Brachyspira sp. TaxID=221953 RepID=UPI0025CE35CA|nr:DciA family protein [uncultured Brachyspira sp.]